MQCTWFKHLGYFRCLTCLHSISFLTKQTISLVSDSSYERSQESDKKILKMTSILCINYFHLFLMQGTIKRFTVGYAINILLYLVYCLRKWKIPVLKDMLKDFSLAFFMGGAAGLFRVIKIIRCSY